MRRFAFIVALVGLGLVPSARAQDHAEVGVFVDYFRLHNTATNFVGLGGRVAVNLAKYVQVEGEISYDFNRGFIEGFTSTGGGTATAVNSNLKILHGLVGPKIHTGGPVKLFATLKGGAINFRFDPRPASFDTFTSSVDNLRDNNVSGVLYPGGGVEAFFGPIGLRLEVGDEIYFNGGAHNNWKASIGPQIRF